MTYVKPEVLAQNVGQGVYAASCSHNTGHMCNNCMRGQ